MEKQSGLLVGVSGLAGSGKSTVAQMLGDSRFITLSLADPIKRIAKEVYAFTDEQLWGPSDCRNEPDKRYPRPDGTYLTPRECLQRFGTEAGRQCYRNTWIDLCIRTAQGLFELNPTVRGVVVPDVRFLNEVDAIHAAGGLVIRIVRPGAGLEGAAGQHGSETEQASIPDEQFNYVIDNSGTLENLREKVLAIVETA